MTTKKQQISDECLVLIHSLIEDVDKCIIDDIRNNPVGRGVSLAQLDVLDKVRERLLARCD